MTLPDQPAGSPIVRLAGVRVRRAGTTILGPLDWTVDRGAAMPGELAS